jgi:NAD+ synthetase
MRVSLFQTKPAVGALDANVSCILDWLQDAAGQGVRMAIAPELAVTGYPPRDLLERDDFLDAAQLQVQRLVDATTDLPVALVFGAPLRAPQPGKPLVNAAILAERGRIVAVHHKVLLPTYDVFDEARYFQAGHRLTTAVVDGTCVALTICEDIWNQPGTGSHNLYPTDPLLTLPPDVQLVVNLAASPYHHGKPALREQIVRNVATRCNAPVIYVNQAGANDELVFDGHSLVADASGRILHRSPGFAADHVVVDIGLTPDPLRPSSAPAADAPDDLQLTWTALVTGLREYMAQTGFRSVLIGLSGGIDSAVTAAIACDALGSERVTGVAMPSRYSSDGSVVDALQLAENLSMVCLQIPIESPFSTFLELLQPSFGNRPADVTEENLQARIRGTILMALSNKTGALLLSTGNKSELAVGYSTLYGDMCGGLSAISDVPKTLVYQLAHWRNGQGHVIPDSTLTKEPSAELRPDQRDQDSLPPYDVLDAIIERFIERGQAASHIVAAGFDLATVTRVIRLIERNEYKRRQAAPGLRVTSRAFGVGRRYPVACGWSAV